MSMSLTGEANGATNGFAIISPSFQGGSGIGEVGTAITPSPALHSLLISEFKVI
ncbi:MAG: hypothetical protein LBD73_08165 [Deferribacteraceae bacterium]|jgi:hypothetical protein|nr:hypothetical protein [Deferribacteraceae bacterium]